MSKSPAPSAPVTPARPSAGSLEPLFNPRSIALVGATERSVWSIAAVDNLRRFGYAGRVHMINPKGGTIFGSEAAPTCSAVGEPIDAALLMVPESKMLEVFDDLHNAGIGGAVILSGGFAETGDGGRQRQQQIADKARVAGIRMLGPNCLGYANFVAGTPIWTTPLRRAGGTPQVALVSQSGALASQLEQFAHQQRVGLTHMISTGNEADVQVADAIEYLAAQPEPRAIALFLESVRDPVRFEHAIDAANAAGKPVVVLKVGSSEASAKAAQAHTGSLVGNDRVFDALCRKLGLSRVHSLEELVVTSDLFARLGAIHGGGVAFIAMSGGMCEIITDQAEAEAIELPTLSADTGRALREVLPPLATPNNPLDVTGAAMVEPELIARSLRTLAQDPKIAALSFVFDTPPKEDARGFARRFIGQVGAGFRESGKPCVMFSHTFSGVTGEARALTEELGVIYSGGGVRHGLNALGQLLRHGAWQRSARTARNVVPEAALRPDSERAVLDFLADRGVPVIPAQVVTSAEAAAACAQKLATPVVLKIASPDIRHKTEVGGVALGLGDAEAVRAAYEQMMQRVQAARPDARLDGVIVSPMRGSGVELFVGTMRDPQWGPAIAVGLGGVFVEVLKDTSLRLLPVCEDDALTMLSELRGSALLDGFRGAPAVDRAALAKIIVAIGDAALALGPDLVSLEINPLLAFDGGIEALDGLTVWEDAREQH
ncbi:acetate--CoA ligase family protein [Solimonas terrae]|uniref:Acetate--CoA ligase family protein n=1 Tax=Solimonas terrae TaxID=1396819 RepID=A0A6M2BPN3_9GAMM|nr:acetate--CoA ligase family protein [Solimonas terrae]NGY04324.1 acetate--CoA ligase family protein [Solimonas terrae]